MIDKGKKTVLIEQTVLEALNKIDTFPRSVCTADYADFNFQCYSLRFYNIFLE